MNETPIKEEVEQLLAIAGIHPDPSKNMQGVHHRDRFEALKSLADMAGLGPITN